MIKLITALVISALVAATPPQTSKVKTPVCFQPSPRATWQYKEVVNAEKFVADDNKHGERAFIINDLNPNCPPIEVTPRVYMPFTMR